MLDFESDFSKPIDFESGFSRRVRVKPRFDDEKEIGQFGAMAAMAVPALAGLVGNLMGKKSKTTGGPPPEAAVAQSVLKEITSHLGPELDAIKKGSVSDSDVVKDVKRAISEIKRATQSNKQRVQSVSSSVTGKVAPVLKSIITDLKQRRMQEQATAEHKKIVAKDNFQKGITTSLKSISARLGNIETRLNVRAPGVIV